MCGLVVGVLIWIILFNMKVIILGDLIACVHCSQEELYRHKSPPVSAKRFIFYPQLPPTVGKGSNPRLYLSCKVHPWRWDPDNCLTV